MLLNVGKMLVLVMPKMMVKPTKLTKPFRLTSLMNCQRLEASSSQLSGVMARTKIPVAIAKTPKGNAKAKDVVNGNKVDAR